MMILDMNVEDITLPLTSVSDPFHFDFEAGSGSVSWKYESGPGSCFGTDLK